MTIRESMSRLLGLIIITAFALAVMIASGTNWLDLRPSADSDAADSAEGVPSPVLVIPIEKRIVAITDHYSGILEPTERFRLGFEIGGRVERLGESATGMPLDDGDRVRAGQVLAVLDTSGLTVRVDEMQALADRAESEWERAERLHKENTQAITEAEHIQRQTDWKVAVAQLKLAQKTLGDATLVSNIDGVISRKLINAGESVAAQQVAFEVVQNDSLILVVGVPESRITAIIDRFEYARGQRLRPDAPTLAADEREFVARVELVAKDALGQPGESLAGVVVRIAQTADETSGLFAVEIRVDNAGHHLRPGQIAVADLIVGRVEAFQIPLSAAQFTDDRAFVYSVEGDAEVLPPTDDAHYTARVHELGTSDYMEQGSTLVVFELAASNIVLRGQNRLVDGRSVKVLTQDSSRSSNIPNGDLGAETSRSSAEEESAARSVDINATPPVIRSAE
jgi:RND family efflux transporter MFP subunit